MAKLEELSDLVMLETSFVIVNSWTTPPFTGSLEDYITDKEIGRRLDTGFF